MHAVLDAILWFLDREISRMLTRRLVPAWNRQQQEVLLYMRALELDEDHALAGPDIPRDASEAVAVNAAGHEITAQAIKVDGYEGRGLMTAERSKSSRVPVAGSVDHESAGQDTQPVFLCMP